MNCSKYKPLAVLLITLLSGPSFATDVIWDGGGDGISWHDGANWDIGVPGISDRAIIDTDSVVISTAVEIGGIVLYSDLTITSSGTLLVNKGSLSLTGGKANDINNYGDLIIIDDQLSIPEDGRYFNRVGSSLTISGGVNGVNNLGRFLNFINSNIYVSYTTGLGFYNSVILKRALGRN